MNKRYTDAQIMWIENNANAKVWKNRDEFFKEFNKTFGLNVTTYQFNNLVLYYKIKIITEQTESLFTDEEKKWLIENAKSGIFKSCADLTDTYNALFRQRRKKDNIYSYLYQWGVTLNTNHNNNKYTGDMDEWLRGNFKKHATAEALTKEFNDTFNTSKTVEALSHRCRKIGLKRSLHRFKKGQKFNLKPVGTIVDRKKQFYIKVNNNNNKSAWVPLKKIVYEKTVGKIPNGYCVISLDGNKHNVDPKNLYCIDRRATPTMAKFGWYTENRVITKDGAEWCNLYFTAKDNGIY